MRLRPMVFALLRAPWPKVVEYLRVLDAASDRELRGGVKGLLEETNL